MNHPWFYVLCGFAGIGAGTVVLWVRNGWKRFIETVNTLTTTLQDAAEVAKAYREDVQILKQIAQSGASPNFGEEPESIIRQPPSPPAAMPSPLWSRFPVKPDEPEAPLEAVGDIDKTPTDEDLIEAAKNEQALDFEAQERQKAATREADQERLRALTEQSGESE